MNEARLWFWIFLDALLGALVIAVFAVGMPATARYMTSLSPARTLTVSAEGKTTAAPDLADLTFGVVTQGQDTQKLSTQNNTQMNSVMDFLSQQGIASSDIQTVGYDLEPNYQYPQNGQQGVIDGYTLTQTVEVKVHDLTKVAALIGGLAPLGVNQISNIDFTFADPTSIVAIARADAMQKAQQQAQQMAAAAGASLGAVVTVSENNNIPSPKYYDYGRGAGAMSTVAAVPSIAPGTQDVTDDVMITYALR